MSGSAAWDSLSPFDPVMPRIKIVLKMKNQTQREGNWECVVCGNFNFSFRTHCNRCALISKEQNEHHCTLLAYNIPAFLTPIRTKSHDAPHQTPPDNLSLSPVLRQLGI